MRREVVAATSKVPKNEDKTKAEERQPPTRDGRERRCLTCQSHVSALSPLAATAA